MQYLQWMFETIFFEKHCKHVGHFPKLLKRIEERNDASRVVYSWLLS